MNFKDHEADKIVIPAIYLYRHSVELILKAIISVGILMDKKLESEKFLGEIVKTKGHNLLNLWNDAVKYIEEYLEDYIKSNPEGLFFMQEVVKELHAFDEKSIKLRYSEDLIVKKKKAKEIKLNDFGDGKESYGINVLTLRVNFDKYYKYLSGSFDAIYYYYENSEVQYVWSHKK